MASPNSILQGVSSCDGCDEPGSLVSLAEKKIILETYVNDGLDSAMYTIWQPNATT
jgi:hypothetical protein